MAWQLLARHINYFLPLRRHVIFSSGRKCTSLIPLFPGYLFLCGNMEDRYQAFATKCVCKMLEVHRQEELRRELLMIEQAIESGEVRPYSRAAVGKRGRVIGGPFMGIEGVIVSMARQARLVLGVNTLNRGVQLEIDEDLLEVLE